MYDLRVRAEALRLVARGMSYREASAAMGGAPSATAIYLWARGARPGAVAVPRRNHRFFSAAEKAAAVSRVLAGEGKDEVAAATGCSVSSLTLWVRLYLRGGERALRTRHDLLLERRAKLGTNPDANDCVKQG